MEKFNVVLVVLDEKSLASALGNLDLAKVDIFAIMTENGGRILTLGDKQIPLLSFAFIQNILEVGKNFLWLIVGQVSKIADINATKKFLMESGVLEENIVNFHQLVSSVWIANLRYVEKYGADFFATGISYTEVGLDLNFIPHVKGRGVNLSNSTQDLLHGYLTAKYIFEHVPPGTIKFVLIGLAPYSLRYDNAKAFSVTTRHLQYMLAIDAPERNFHDRLLKNLVNDNFKNKFKNVMAQHADLNFDKIKNAPSHAQFSAQALVNWQVELKDLTKKLYPDTIQKNFQILQDYIKLCLRHGAKPIGVVFPFAPIIRKNYSEELLNSFRTAIRQLQADFDFVCVDLFDFNLGYECFYNTAHLNPRGAATLSTLLGLQLYAQNIISTGNFCAMNYDYFNSLSKILPKDDYNSLMARVFKISAKKISRKNKIKIGFVLYDASMWCGDKLYNLFARDERFETTIFLCLRTDKHNDELVQEDFIRGVNQFQARKLNVVGISYAKANVPVQDVLIFLTPYTKFLPEAFDFKKLTANTLMIYIPYAFDTSLWYENAHMPIVHLTWKNFFHSEIVIDYFDKNCRVGMPRGIYSGYPRLDTFFEDELQFTWKMTRPDAKKIIWAPHWSINGGVKYATFRWNFKFMYEFAKAHPEISWTVKPHPGLLLSAVDTGVFPSAEEFRKYLQAWNDLPNAQVYTGGYYQAIFATSDGMIHDSGSFIGEYQYMDKPMIYLTRDTQTFNDLGKLILSTAYLIDGRDLEGIAALLQRVFIDGNDYKAADRKEIFDKYLNYPKHNGMLASNFIYKNIAAELY